MTEEHNKLTAPIPEVLHLPTIFRRIENGEIRMPAFQRGFVWKREQVVELLESVYKGYPIGSALLWRVDTPGTLKIENNPTIPFPQPTARYPINFILDGMQRLSTLYGVIHSHDKRPSPMFDVHFDLIEETFHYSDDIEPNQITIPLSALSSPRKLLDVQRGLIDTSQSDLLIERSVKLQSVFQEYLIPTVTITSKNVSQVVEIFERINNTGTSLSVVDFMRAMTWSESFDFNEQLERIRHALRREGFALPGETMVKSVAVVVGKDPVLEDMLGLKEFEPAALDRAVTVTAQVLIDVVRYLKTYFHIQSLDFIPYQGQILALVKLFSLANPPPDAALDAMRRWIWATSFSEGLQGKSESFVARALVSIARLVGGDDQALQAPLKLSAQDFLTKRLIRKKAFSSAAATMFAAYGARSPTSGETINPLAYMNKFETDNYLAIYPLEAVRRATANAGLQSAKVPANVLLVTASDRRQLAGTDRAELFRSLMRSLDSTSMTSQFLTTECLSYGLEGDVARFLLHRSKLMFEASLRLCATGHPQEM